MTVDLFAGIPVRDRASAIDWYSRLLGGDPAFLPNDVEAVWEVAEHGYLYVEERPADAGHARHTLFVEDLGDRLADAAARGVVPDHDETYDNGGRKVTFRDPDGNETGFGGQTAPAT
jgi:predicted enzyme related to lactoylglutathione lyase